MDEKSVFNLTVCVIGVALLLIHSLNVLLKRGKRKDEKFLLVFFLFTAAHFATYLAFTLLKAKYASNTFIIGFYTTFYILNNIQALLLFGYSVSYIASKKKIVKIVTIVNMVIFTVFVILDVVNIFNHMFFYAENGVYTRAKTMFISQGYQLFTFGVVFLLSLFSKRLKVTEKISFAVYCILPLIAIILQNLFPGYAIAYLSIIVAIEILLLFINVRKNMELANEAKRNKEAEIKIMMSQIRPHFVYNALSSISTLIKINPDKAQKGLDDFTEYLRANFSSLTYNGLIFFSDELKHIETYLALEKMRFGDRLNVVYDIKVKDFLLPPLSVQPIVENAVKHGILEKLEGGTVTIKTYENKHAYVVEVKDDGVGFNVNQVMDNNHIGLKNVKYRLSTMCHGELKISSQFDKGTKATMLFYK